MEMNTRLQVEHPVTEWTSGVDIVSQQFAIAGGESIVELDVQQNGYAIEARVNAERIQMIADGELVFRPHPGEIGTCAFPEDEGVEIIATAERGKFVSPYYDSLVAQIVVHAVDRDSAVAKLDDYLSRVDITGICTNVPLLRRILQDEVFKKGIYDTNYLPELLTRSDVPSLISEIEASAGDVSGGFNVESIVIDESNELKVLAPATAIFYSTPSPSEPEYVNVGDRIRLQETLCQLEAMKMFTPLCLADFNTESVFYADSEYEITRINMGNGQQVNVGDLLFVVKPLAD